MPQDLDNLSLRISLDLILSMGEAKVLVEMELDKDFLKLIALDDKQGNIFLVNVEYTWIPSMCERCGNLGHKEKRCLLPSTTPQVPNSSSVPADNHSEVHVVDIDIVIKKRKTLPRQIRHLKSFLNRHLLVFLQILLWTTMLLAAH